jgi:hypothetical protein
MPVAPMSRSHIKATMDADTLMRIFFIRSWDLLGEKMKDSLAVPNLWTRNSTTRKPIEIAEILFIRLGTLSAMPTTAEVMETAGVSIPSANARAVPNSVCERDYVGNGVRNEMKTNPTEKRPPDCAQESGTDRGCRRGTTRGIAGEASLVVLVSGLRWVKALVQSEGASFTFAGAKSESKDDL